MNSREYQEQEKLKLIEPDMYCKRYELECEAVPDEIITFIDGFGFKAYSCNLECRNCRHMERF